MDNLNDKQIEAVQHGRGPLLIAAGAGSGKTKTLVSRLLHLLKTGVPPEKIIAITFTNKAANEMKKRVAQTLGEPSLKDPEKQLFVGTFHSFGVKILKNEASYFKRTGNFTIFDNDDSLSLIKKILKEKDLPKERYNPIAVLGKISNFKSELYPVRNSPPTGPSGAQSAGEISNGVNPQQCSRKILYYSLKLRLYLPGMDSSAGIYFLRAKFQLNVYIYSAFYSPPFPQDRIGVSDTPMF